jgi:hypothetical protein
MAGRVSFEPCMRAKSRTDRGDADNECARPPVREIPLLLHNRSLEAACSETLQERVDNSTRLDGERGRL